jgi:hypothetical protein
MSHLHIKAATLNRWAERHETGKEPIAPLTPAQRRQCLDEAERSARRLRGMAVFLTLTGD